MKPNMRVPLCGLDLVNPVIAASGTFGYGVEFEEIVNLRRIGGLVTKGISAEPMAGNQSPRLIETAAGMINAIGLQNVGVEKFLADKLPPLRNYPSCAVIVNVFGYTIDDYLAVIDSSQRRGRHRRLRDQRLLPQHQTRRHRVRLRPRHALRSRLPRQIPLHAPASSSSSRPTSPPSPSWRSSAQRAGADAVSLVNTFLALPIDVETRRSRLANITGGLSGPAIKPIAVRMVWEAAKAVTIPVIGLGGIVTPEDAVEFLLAGATAVQVGTASYADPRATERIAQGLEQWCARHHVARVADLIGALDTALPNTQA